MEKIEITAEEIAEAKAEAAKGVFTHTFKKPFDWEGRTYGEITFDMDSLTGRDMLDINAELKANGLIPIVRNLDIEFLMRAAVKACKEPLGSDAFEAMSGRDFNSIINRAQGFFTHAD